MLLTLSPFLINSLLFLILMMISIRDLKEGIIPDILLVLMAMLGILRFGGIHGMSVAILGILSYGLYKLYPFLKNQEWLGFGDVKMMMVSGLWLEVSQIPLFLMVGGGIGIGIALFWRVLKNAHRFPLGPALALALGICIVGQNGLSIGEHKMTTTFTTHSLPPASGLKPDSIVVFIHGYGANGEDLLALGSAWASLLPNTLFVAPDGPDRSGLNPSGNQWFSLEDWDPAKKLTKDQVARMVRDIQALTPSFNQYLDELLRTHGLPPEKLALVGFSQGAMVALHIGLHRPLCAGIIAYSGAFLEDPKEAKIARPPVLLIHGIDDELLSPTLSKIAEGHLQHLHVPVTLSLLPGLGHGIDGRGLEIGGAFLKQHLDEAIQADLWEPVKKSSY
jgi:phospholipase/carboxylesterase